MAPRSSGNEDGFFMLDCASMPTELYNAGTPFSEWQKRFESAGKEGFAPGTLGKTTPLNTWIQVERMLSIGIYVLFNILPFAFPALMFILGWRWILGIAGTIFVLDRILIARQRPLTPEQDKIKLRERMFNGWGFRTQKYTSLRMVWPKSLKRPQEPSQAKPTIFCVVPHGVMPLGINAYPYFSSLFGDRYCHWSAAKVVLKLPLVSTLLKALKYIPAEKRAITKCLEEGGNVGIILDGIAGMFQSAPGIEKAYLAKRKGAIKLALRGGFRIQPVYGFGHTQLWKTVLDPWGVLEKISIAINVSIVPFLGRFGIPFAGPSRVPVLLAFGEPVDCPKVLDPTPDDINSYHRKMLDSFETCFDTHKAAYGWADKTLKFV